MNKFDLPIHKKVNDRTVTYDPKTKMYSNSTNTIKIKNVYDARAYNKLLNEPTTTPTQVNDMSKRIDNARQYGGTAGQFKTPREPETLFQDIFSKKGNGLAIHDKKPITTKMKANREVIKSIQPLNVDRYLEIRNAEPVPTKRIEPIRQEDPDMKQGIGALYKST